MNGMILAYLSRMHCAVLPTADSQRDPQAPIHLSGASIGHERDDRARRDKGEPKALAFDLADAEEGGQGRRHDQCSANPEQPRYDATNDSECTDLPQASGSRSGWRENPRRVR